MPELGWIIDLYPRNQQMILWLKKPDGTCVRLVDNWNPAIHVCGKLGDLLDLACQPFMGKCRFVEKFEHPGDPTKSKVLEVPVQSEKEAAQLAEDRTLRKILKVPTL